LVEFKGCGHLVPFEKPKELALEILNYLEGSDLIKE
jgi:pimeloyl-ACP methyl ester carboxylesterase